MNSDVGSHLGQTVVQVITSASERLIKGDLAEYEPIPTGFDQLDRFISGGLRKTELTLLGGAQGVGKTIASLQMARNIASAPGQYAYYLSFEHTEVHLLHRLLCMESLKFRDGEASGGIRLRDLYRMIVADEAIEAMRTRGAGAFLDILRNNSKTDFALNNMEAYADRLILVKASPTTTTLQNIKKAVERLCDATGGNVTVFVDYLQKISVAPEKPTNEEDKVTIIAEGLKDIAMTLEVPIWSIVAADREGLRSRRIHLYHLRGSSALDYEADIAIIMSNKYSIIAKNHISYKPERGSEYRKWVIFTIEKNRAGQAFQNIEFELHGANFVFNSQGNIVRELLVDDRVIE